VGFIIRDLSLYFLRLMALENAFQSYGLNTVM
jgi:hypothetical protein